MKREKQDIPPERGRQFGMFAQASEGTLRWAERHGIPLEHIEPVVPFVETDWSLDAWLFLDTEDRIRRYQFDGTADEVAAQFLAHLAGVGYPKEWLRLVTCHFGSREIVDRDYEGSYALFLR